MSRLQKSMLKPPSSSNTTNASSSSSNDFASELNSKLSKLSLNNHSPPLKTTLSPSSPLSRQESRQNSLISFILNPEDDLESSMDSSKQKHIDQIYGVEQLIDSLIVSNKMKLTLEEKDLILSHLYRMLINGSNEVYLGNNGLHGEMLLNLLRVEPKDSSLFTWQVWLRCVDAMITVDVDSVGDEVVSTVLPYFLRWSMNTINGGESVDVDMDREALKLKSFALSLLILYSECENHSMLKNVAIMMFLLQSPTKLSDDVVSSICDVIAIAIGLAFESGRNCDDVIIGTVDDIGLLELIEILFKERTQNRDLKQKLCFLTALCFECCQEPEESFDELIDLISDFNNEGVKKQGKSNSKDTNKNLIKYCLKTLNGESSLLDSIALTKTKFIKIKSFVALFRLDILKFSLLGNVRVWVIKNKELRDCLKVQLRKGDGVDEDVDEDSEDEDGDGGDYRLYSNSNSNSNSTKKLSNKERTILINRARDSKINEG